MLFPVPSIPSSVMKRPCFITGIVPFGVAGEQGAFWQVTEAIPYLREPRRNRSSLKL